MAGISLIDCFSLQFPEVVGTFETSLFSQVAEWVSVALFLGTEKATECARISRESASPSRRRPHSQISCRRCFPKQVLPSSWVQRLNNPQAALQTEKKNEGESSAYCKNIKRTRFFLLRWGNRFQEQCVCSSVIILKVVGILLSSKTHKET